MIFYFDAKYLFLTFLLLLTEICIALFINDSIVRPFVGDVLVICLIYCLVRILLQGQYLKIALDVLIFAFAIEIGQYFDFVKIFGLENNRILSVMLGRTFSFEDFAAYFVGFLIVVFSERFLNHRKLSNE